VPAQHKKIVFSQIQDGKITPLSFSLRPMALGLERWGGKGIPRFCQPFRKIFSGSVHYDLSWYLRILL
jgi:hypothetical protein